MIIYYLFFYDQEQAVILRLKTVIQSFLFHLYLLHKSAQLQSSKNTPQFTYIFIMAVKSMIPCSATAPVLAFSACTTKHLLLFTVAKSTLSMPNPAIPTAFGDVGMVDDHLHVNSSRWRLTE